MKKLIYFFLICFCILGVIGGVGYAIYNSAWAIAAGVAVLGYTAWPKFKDYVVRLTL